MERYYKEHTIDTELPRLRSEESHLANDMCLARVTVRIGP